MYERDETNGGWATADKAHAGPSWLHVHASIKRWALDHGYVDIVDMPLTPTKRIAQPVHHPSAFPTPAGAMNLVSAGNKKIIKPPPPNPEPEPEPELPVDDDDIYDKISLFD